MIIQGRGQVSKRGGISVPLTLVEITITGQGHQEGSLEVVLPASPALEGLAMLPVAPLATQGCERPGSQPAAEFSLQPLKPRRVGGYSTGPHWPGFLHMLKKPDTGHSASSSCHRGQS